MKRTFSLLLASALVALSLSAQTVVRRPITAGGVSTTSLVSVWHLDSVSATSPDAHGANDLTNYNTATQVTGQLSNAAHFAAASNQMLYHADNADLSIGGTDASFIFWFQLDSKTTTRGLFQKDDGSAGVNREYGAYYESSGDRVHFYVFSGSTYYEVLANNFGSPTTGTWYFCRCWVDTTNHLLGIRINEGTANTASYSGTVLDGTANFAVGVGGGAWSDGPVDEFVLFKRLVTDGEAGVLYGGGAGLAYPWS